MQFQAFVPAYGVDWSQSESKNITSGIAENRSRARRSRERKRNIWNFDKEQHFLFSSPVAFRPNCNASSLPRFQSSNIPIDPVITITISVGCICYCCYESSVSVVRFAKFTRVKWLGTRIWHYDPWTNWFQNFSNCLHSVGFICVCASLSVSVSLWACAWFPSHSSLSQKIQCIRISLWPTVTRMIG